MDILDAYGEYVLPTYFKTPLIFVKGKGSRLWDIHQKEYLDFFPGWGVGSLGHCHPKVVQALRDQMKKLIFVPNNYYHPGQAKLAEMLVKASFPGKVFFCNSGAEANEGAFKLARKFGEGRYEIITFENAFHGRTMAALAATGQKKYMAGFEPLPQGFAQVPFNNLDAVKRAVNAKTVAVLLEVVQGEGGINVATPEFVSGLRAICDEKNLLLVVDEVQTGIGRTGAMFAYQHYGITPDIMTLAKALGGGVPIGAMVVHKKHAAVLSPGTHASTFGGGPLACRAGIAVLKAVKEERLLGKCREMGEYLFSKLFTLKDSCPLVRDVRGKGLMAGVELKVPGKEIVTKCMAKGLLINCTHDNVLRLMPALVVTRKEIDKAAAILGAVLKEER